MPLFSYLLPISGSFSECVSKYFTEGKKIHYVRIYFYVVVIEKEAVGD